MWTEGDDRGQAGRGGSPRAAGQEQGRLRPFGRLRRLCHRHQRPPRRLHWKAVEAEALPLAHRVPGGTEVDACVEDAGADAGEGAAEGSVGHAAEEQAALQPYPEAEDLADEETKHTAQLASAKQLRVPEHVLEKEEVPYVPGYRAELSFDGEKYSARILETFEKPEVIRKREKKAAKKKAKEPFRKSLSDVPTPEKFLPPDSGFETKRQFFPPVELPLQEAGEKQEATQEKAKKKKR
eukprot:CAMPEP_0114633170 /NCGR_PEP_ID=MMETSP0168-20121206/15310_1 /TAXON_ID=95228 ORGANISM="Vannella sp., Strain DIVA3 517/6/12" /NCGR_SAMPLE_ID=MMETSP0168 /ASSEMBLY_ACC=CAM_ASM_000044 /LENGTH=237 /DNA_ID=CAMNT_0001844799 /DNA_START=217 /DNA_END=929 /DNA_ORIENTATION=-